MTRALLISRFFPYNAEKVHGIYQRLGTQIEALARVADRIDCLFLVPVDQDCSAEAVREHQERLRRLWSPAIDLTLAPTLRHDAPQGRWQRVVEGIFDFQRQLIARPTCTAAAVAAVSAALDTRPDLVLVHRLDAMGVLMRLSRGTPQKLRGVPLFFDLDDIEHVAQARHLLHDPAWPAQRLLLLQLPALLLAELRAVRLATATFVCSESDRRYLARLSAGARVCTVPNSVTFPPLAAADSSEPLVLFVGAMGYRPNAQAADSLVEEIWPPLHARVPAARLAIIGPGRERARSFHKPDPTVTFTGFVDELQSWYRRARVVCCPIYHGGGTRIKIIEAAAQGKAIVSTHIGAEGLIFEDGREILLRDSADAIAAACAQLLEDPAAAQQLGRAALQKASGTYERGAVVKQLEDIFRSAFATGARRVPA
jgi:glycosyltransferase involved in cell wall biosynthesis